MNDEVIRKGYPKKDAIAKVTGKARYTADYAHGSVLIGKVVRSTIAHGLVRSIDVTEARNVQGVRAILVPDDIQELFFPTCGHPYNLNNGKKDIEDKNILTRHVKYYGDEIAAIVADDLLSAQKAERLLRIEYEPWPHYLLPKEATEGDSVLLHQGCFPDLSAQQQTARRQIQNRCGNLIGQDNYIVGDETEFEVALRKAALNVGGTYETQIVQHCSLETHCAMAYTDENERIVVVSSTQIPHICRRILAQAFGMPVSRFKVIKPYVGGGFGSKQDVILEPIVVAMTLAVNGKPVLLEYQREENMSATRTRHAASFDIQTAVDKNGIIIARDAKLVSNNGAYAAHGHSIAQVMAGSFIETYLRIH